MELGSRCKESGYNKVLATISISDDNKVHSKWNGNIWDNVDKTKSDEERGKMSVGLQSGGIRTQQQHLSALSRKIKGLTPYGRDQ